MAETLPPTVFYPKAFLESPPANFDGVFHWQYIDDVLKLTRGIRCCDIDSCTEISGHFLTIETKNVGVPIPDAQKWTHDALLRTGLVTHLNIWGKEIPKRWQIRRFENGQIIDGAVNESYDGREAIAYIVDLWRQWAVNQTPAMRAYRAFEAAWLAADTETRERICKDILRPSMGVFDDTPLGQSVISRTTALKQSGGNT